jgi:hypothetical protein
MQYNIKDHGDPFEKKCYNLISNKIRDYKLFWSDYVGNNNGKPENINGISEEINKKRILVAQWNYTLLRNVYTTQKLYERNKNKKARDISNAIDQEVDFIISTHLLFNTIEIIRKIEKTIEKKDVIKENWAGFIEFRNCLTHNIKPLTKIEQNIYHVPKNFDWFLSNNTSTDESWIWSDKDFFKNLQFQQFPSFLDWCFQKSITVFNDILNEEIIYFSHNMAGKTISSAPEYKTNNNNILKPKSGTTIN